MVVVILEAGSGHLLDYALFPFSEDVLAKEIFELKADGVEDLNLGVFVFKLLNV